MMGRCVKENKRSPVRYQNFSDSILDSNPCDGNNILGGIHRKISDPMNSRLTQPVEDLEIHTALFSMNSHTAPGPDGMSPGFFQHF